MRILILGKLQPSDEIVEEIKAVASDVEVRREENWKEAESALKKAEVIVTTKGEFPREAVNDAPNLKWVHSLMVGVESFLYPEFTDRDIMLTNPRGAADVAVSEHAFALMLSWTRGIPRSLKLQKERKWDKVQVNHMKGKTMGIIGLGSIGQEIARKAKEAFRMSVMATKRKMTQVDYVDKLLSPEEIDDLLCESDYIVVAAAMTKETDKLIGEREFKIMKPDAFFVNIARGQIVDEKALIKALENKWIAGAGLDVFEMEPLAKESPLWQMENVIITPHIAGVSDKKLADLRVKVFIENLKSYKAGRGLLTEVDKELGY